MLVYLVAIYNYITEKTISYYFSVQNTWCRTPPCFRDRVTPRCKDENMDESPRRLEKNCEGAKKPRRVVFEALGVTVNIVKERLSRHCRKAAASAGTVGWAATYRT
jgi:hypothetical protein